MNSEKVHHVLEALSKERIETLSKEALVNAFHDDGIFDLEGVAEQMLKRIRHDSEVQRTEPRLLDFTFLSRPTPPELSSTIRHNVPKIPFRLGGTLYDPEDITRFNGQALHFFPTIDEFGELSLEIFTDEIKPVITGYLQMRRVASLISTLDVYPPGQSLPPYPPDDNDSVSVSFGCGGTTGIPCGKPADPPTTPPQPKSPPHSYGQLQMFDDANYEGNWLWLAKGYMWTDLRSPGRGGWFGGDWNDQISSIASTDTFCVYCEHINLGGSNLVLGANKPMPDLAAVGWNDRISSVYNYGYV